MNRLIVAALFAVAFVGCSRQTGKEEEKVDVVVAPPKGGEPDKVVAAIDPAPLFAAPSDPANVAYDAKLTEALTLLADRDLEKALEAFEAARAAKETEFVKGEIAKLRSRIESEASAKKTLAEIQSILDDGNAKDASKLVDKALQEFGGGAAAGKLVQLQAQADALGAIQTDEDPKVRFQRLRDRAQVALQDDNVRAAAALLQQALQLFDDAGVRDQLRELQGRTERYDDLRRRASELRRNPDDVDDALELYKEAARVWNTPDVRQDIDDCMLALQKRRDTLSVADFEVLGDVGVPAAGQAIADELLPTFKARFDLVERRQVAKIVQELNLGAGFQNIPEQQRELGRLARVRFLVLGSVRGAGAFTAQARLVDTASGLIVQTAKVSAPTFDQLVARLPDLTRQLLMSDAEKLAFDAEQMRVARRIDPAPADAPLPAAPAVGAPVGGPWFDAAPPPGFGALQAAQFRALPPAPAVPPPQVVIVEPPPPILRGRMVHAVVLQGDGFFARGHYREAHRQYEFALSLAPNDFDIRARLDACRPLLPPPVVVVRPVAVRPRMAMLNFLVVGDPRVVPPGLSVAAPDLLAPYFLPNFDVVDTGEVYWMMGRLGMTQADLMNDPNARRWLGRALHVQFFLMGTIEQTASFDVSTYLLNAEQGWLQGSARMHFRNPFDLKMRAGELAHLTQLPPGQRAQFVAAEPQVNLLIARGQDGLRAGNFQIAISFFAQALSARPSSVQAAVYLNQAQQARRQWEMEEARRQEIARQQALAAQARQRQIELARAAEAARLRTAQEAAARAEAERFAAAKQRAGAYGDMVTRARLAVEGRNFGLAINLFQGALDLAPTGPMLVPLPVPRDALVDELAQARAAAARANEERDRAEKAAARETQLRLEREKQLAVARQKIEEERRKAEAEALAQQKLIDVKYQAAFDQGQLLMSQEKFESAIVALQAARQLKKTDAVEAMIAAAVTRQAEAAARAKGEAERMAIEEKLAAQRKRQKAAQEEAKRVQGQYEETLKMARESLARKDFAAAEEQFHSAGKLFKTDDVLNGLKQIESARSAEKEKSAKTERVAKLLLAGQSAFAAGQFADSVQKLEMARKLDPTNVDVLAALSRAEQARDRAIIEQQQKAAANQAAKEKAAKLAQEDALKNALAAKQAQEEEQKKALAKKQARDAAIAQALQRGQSALASKDYAAAIQAYQDALKLDPTQPQAMQGVQQAQAGLQAAANQAAKEKAAKLAQEEEQRKALAAKQAQEEEQRKALALKKEQAAKQAQEEEQRRKIGYAQAMRNGVALANQKKFAEAIQSFQAARSLYPNDPQATQWIAQTTQAWEASKQPPPKKDPPKQVEPPKKPNPPAEEPGKKKAAAARAEYLQHMAVGQKLLAARQFSQAAQQFEAALRLVPGDPVATQMLQQARNAKK